MSDTHIPIPRHTFASVIQLLRQQEKVAAAIGAPALPWTQARAEMQRALLEEIEHERQILIDSETIPALLRRQA